MERIAYEVKKPVEAIQCANTFGLLQRKMYNVLLANAAGHLRPEVTHRISIGTLCKLMGYKSRDYETIKNRFRELRRMDIEWDIINENGNKVWTNTSPLSLARVIEGEGICEYEFTKSLLPYLDKPAQYAKFSLAIQSQFKSSYGLALYENCERYRKIGYTKAFDLPTFRKLMGLKETEYLEFFAMKRRVIDKAIKEVNTYADYNITPEYEKKGRNVVKIKFTIALKNTIAGANTNIIAERIQDDLQSKLVKIFGFDKAGIENLICKYESNYIEEKINYILSTSSFKNGEIDNLSAYLSSALSHDYKHTRSSKDVMDELKLENQLKEDARIELERKQRELATAKCEYQKYKHKHIMRMINECQIKKSIDIEHSFLEHLKAEGASKITFDAFTIYGYNSGLVSSYLESFACKIYPETMENIITFEDFIKKEFPNAYVYYLQSKNP